MSYKKNEKKTAEPKKVKPHIMTQVIIDYIRDDLFDKADLYAIQDAITEKREREKWD
jgi:hypothetical protein